MVTMGMISVIFAALMLISTPDIKRMFAYSSIEHMGIIVFAFGMAARWRILQAAAHDHALATNRRLLRSRSHCAGQGTQKIADMGGLTVTNPVLGWGLVSASSRLPDCRRSASS